MIGNYRQALGRRGERLAEAHFLARGARLLERNYRRDWGEIDLLLLYEDALVAVEVKTREAEDFVAPEECLRWHQLRRINRGLQYYAVDNDVYELPWRIDAVLVVIDQDGAVRRFEHLRNVFPA